MVNPGPRRRAERIDIARNLASALLLVELTRCVLGYVDVDVNDVIAHLRKSNVERLDQQITAARDERGRTDIVAAITFEPE